MAPRLVDRIATPDGHTIHDFQPRKVRQVIPPAVADSMVNMLCGVVQVGTGRITQIPGVRVAGKTGTAQMAAANRRGYEKGAYIASFIGFLPDMNPRLICVVSVTKPQGIYYGSTVAGPVFRRIMTRIINRDAAIIRPVQGGNEARMPNLIGMTDIGASTKLAELRVPVTVTGSGPIVTGQWPPSLCRLPEGRPVELTFADQTPSGPAVPRVTGMTLRQAVAALTAAGLVPEWQGSGIVHAQLPIAGSVPELGGTVKLSCGRGQAQIDSVAIPPRVTANAEPSDDEDISAFDDAPFVVAAPVAVTAPAVSRGAAGRRGR
jgi:membrane peptidoglycan carboxypeptidase